MLRKIRAETEQKQKEAKALRERREQQRQARLIAARQRQRARLGLPPLDPKEIIGQTEEHKEPEAPVEEVSEDLEVRLKKAAHVRPWDVGKDGAQQPVMTQEEWVEKKREERIDEFAPMYPSNPTATMGGSASIIDPIANETTDSVKKKKKKKKKKKTLLQTIHPESLDIPMPEMELPEETNPMFSRTKNFLKKRNAAKAGFDAHEEPAEVGIDICSSRGAAVPPPMDFDYHTPAVRRRHGPSGSNSHQETADAIEAGLRLLRQQYAGSGVSKDTRMDS
ncbi:hypothetical protein GE061_019221 [Apolygus lucorum]|uniref:Uncharacterized protein n=1 Tax=Apolygus lucorum TaxID=248454 RepID=A0A6A4JNK7_APOLU|nr:hypothetical protein GE061_019221 [Apolygus lucorum]